MAINRIENTAQIISDCLVIDRNTVETIVRIPPTIYKEVDKCEACVGDILTYTITIRNNSLCPLKNIVFNDRIPYGTDYILNTFEVDDVPQVPSIDDYTLYYTIPTIEPMGTVVIRFQVQVRE